MAGKLTIEAGDDRIVALITCPNSDCAETIASAILKKGMAACVNLIPGITSVYRWEGEICRDSEYLLVVKTLISQRDSLLSLLKSLHPYEEPELIFLPIHSGSESYLAWLTKQIIAEKST